jgi:hypothetical protein
MINLSVRTQAVLTHNDLTLPEAKQLTHYHLSNLPHSSDSVAREILSNDWEHECYGMSEQELINHVDRHPFGKTPDLAAMYILSDAQEIITNGKDSENAEYVRQLINRVKWIITTRMKNKSTSKP